MAINCTPTITDENGVERNVYLNTRIKNILDLHAEFEGTNTAIGIDALRVNEGTNNTASGYAALRANTTGNNNTANGYAALRSNTTGINNTANGYYTLYSNTTGNNNTAVGGNAGRYLKDSSTSAEIVNNSVLIGYNAKVNANDETNQIVIGYNATGKGSNTAVLGNDSIAETYLKGTVYSGTQNNPKELATKDYITNLKGAANGLAELNENGHIPIAQIPGSVDELEEYDNKTSFPAVGKSDKIYVDKNTNKIYRWSGTDYVEISKSLALGETTSTAYAGNKGALNKTRIDNIMDGTVTVDRAKKDGEGLQIRGNYVRKSELYTEGVIKEDLIPLKSLPSLVFQISSPQDNIIYDGTDTVLLDLYNDFANKADKSHPHDAGDINSGVFHEETIPNLDASKITTGTFGTSRIPSLPASKINSGELSTQRIPNLPISKIEDLGTTLSAMDTAIAGKSEKGHTHSQYLTEAPDDSRISDTNILNWNAAYGWGNHANAGYLKSAPNTYITSGNYSTPPAGKRWVSTSHVSSPTYSVGTTASEPDSNVLPSPSGLSAGTTGHVYTQSLPMQEAYYIVQEIEVDHGLITLTRNNGGKVEFTIPKPDGGGGGDLSGYVPTSRTIAGKNLESDITVASLQSALNVPTSISDLLAQPPSNQTMLVYSYASEWRAVEAAPNATKWGGYGIKVGSFSEGSNNYITFGI